MEFKEKIAYMLGSIIVIYGAYVTRNLTNAMAALVICVLLFFVLERER